MSRRRVALSMLALLLLSAIYVVRIREDMVDFAVNLRAAERIVAGQALYQTSDGHFMFKYFPAAAILYVPFTALPVEAAKAIWYALTALGAIAMFYLCKRIVSGGAARPWWVWAIPPVVLAKFCLRELKLGQINILVTVLLLLMVVELLRSRHWAAGWLAGLATALKPYGLVFVPYFVVTRNWRALAGTAAVLVGAFLLPAVFYGVEGNLEMHREWYLTLTQSTPAQLGVADNVSVFGAFTKWTGDPALGGTLAAIAVGLAAVLVLAVIVRGRGVASAVVLEGALLLTLIPFVSPMGWDYQFLTAALAVSLLAEHFESVPARALLAVDLIVIGFSIYDLVGRAAYRAFMNASVLTSCFAVVIGYLAWLRFRELA